MVLDDPAVNFAISKRGNGLGVDHFGFQADNEADLAQLQARAETAQGLILDEGRTTCCYARSAKLWVTDPQGLAWEHFQTLENIPVFMKPMPRRPARVLRQRQTRASKPVAEVYRD